MEKLVLILFLFFSHFLSFSQSDSSWNVKPELTTEVYLDNYYVFDFNQPTGVQRQNFLFNHNRHNEFNLNLGYIKLNVNHSKYRANLALQTVTYVQDNYVNEPGVLKNIAEANIGFSLNKNNKLWLDMGIIPSHIGFESAISFDNLTLTRSLLAENSPYFLSGAKITYSPNSHLEMAALVINGWQRIQRLQGNSLPSLGTQLNYSKNNKFTFNWSSFIGTDEPDSTRKMRIFNNFYGIFQIKSKWNMILGFDIGFEQDFKHSSTYDHWFSPVFIVQYQINENFKTSFRAEYYQDENEVMIQTNSINGFQTFGYSLNLDYSPTPFLVCKLEGRLFKSKDAIFFHTPLQNLIKDNYFISTSVAFRFSK